MLERTKMMDELYIAHNVKINQLVGLVQQMKIDEDADVKQLVHQVNQQIQAKRETLQKKMDMTPEEQKIIDEEVAKLRSCDITPDARNMIPVDTIMRCHAALSACSIRLREKPEKEFEPKRIQLLKDNKEAEYDKAVAEFEQQIRLKTSSMQQAFIKTLGANP